MTDPDKFKIDVDLTKISRDQKIIIILLMLMLFMVFYHYNQIDACVEVINTLQVQNQNITRFFFN